MKEKKGRKKGKWFIIIGAIFLLAIIILGTLYFSGVFNKHGRYPGNFQGRFMNGSQMRNFQLNESQISDINSFFSGNPSASDVQSYCSTNRSYCFYYCRNLNPTSAICSSIMNFSRPPQVGTSQ